MQKIIIIAILNIVTFNLLAQQSLELQLQKRGEIVVSIDASNLVKLPNQGSWSIDKVENDKAYIYLNSKYYNKLLNLNIPFTLESNLAKGKVVKMANNTADAKNWDAYPDYETYLAMMAEYANNYPDICMLDTIGYSTENRLLLALKISDNVRNDETEPEFFYTSSMHGDELTGYVLMLRFIDYLLSNYQTPDIKEMVDGIEIYINPLANPDGTFAGGNESVDDAIRFNANHVDINRNFPDPKRGNHPDGEVWQAETLAMIDYMQKRDFSLSMNFHGGKEVINYPWDTFEERHVDTDWFELVSRQYADTVHTFDDGYLTDLDNGVTNGYDWYEVAGGRQDYMTYFLLGREITAELSGVKLVDADELPGLWDKNFNSLLNFMKQALYGIHGKVTDVNGDPISAKISILDHDSDSTHVRTQKSGVFYRYLKEGTYNIKISASGYKSVTLNNIEVKDFEKTALSIQMEEGVGVLMQKTVEAEIFPNPNKGIFNVLIPNKGEVVNSAIYTLEGRLVWSSNKKFTGQKTVNVHELKNGIYIFKAELGSKLAVQKIIVE